MKEINLAQMTGLTSPNPLTLVCTKKEDGSTNISTISWGMPLSFNPNLFAVAINHGSHAGERIRETGEVVLTIPSIGSESYIMGCGSTNGGKVNKAKEFNIELMSVDGTDIQIPTHTTAAVIGKLVRYEETGDHNLYIFEVKSVFANEEETPLFAWKGYAEAAPAQKA